MSDDVGGVLCLLYGGVRARHLQEEIVASLYSQDRARPRPRATSLISALLSPRLKKKQKTCVNIKTSLTERVSNAALHRAVIRVIALNGFTEKEKTKKKKGALFFPKQNWFGLL